MPTQGFELAVPAGWKLQRQLTRSGSQVVGVVLVPRSGQPHGATVTVTAHDDQELTPQQLARYTLELQMADSQRADGRLYTLLPGRLYTLRSGRGGTSPPARVRSSPMSSPGMPGPPHAGRCRCPPGSHQPARGPPFGSCW